MPTLAIDIGGTKTSVALVDENNDDAFLEHATWPSLRLASGAIDRIVTTCAEWASRANSVGVSFGGPFDFSTQRCIRSMHTQGWDGVELSAHLKRELGIDVLTDNDANVAALGEYAAAINESKDPMLYVTVSTGVGAAVVIDGAILRGAHSLAGELGHLPIGHDRVCSCGQHGCLERAVSGYWIEYDFGKSPEEYLRDSQHHATWISLLARGLWSASVLLDPAIIIVGGGMAAQGDRLAQSLRAELDRIAAQSKRTAPALQLGDPTGRTVLLGAAMMAREATRGSR